MPGAARLGDSILGTTDGEHMGHIPPHTPSELSGYIDGGCASNVQINGVPAATIGSTTKEFDDCCGSNSGNVAAGSSSVYINGRPAARIGDAIKPHNGSAVITTGSGNVIIGG